MSGPTATWKVSFGARRWRRPASTQLEQLSAQQPTEAREGTISEPQARTKGLASSLARRLALAHHIEQMVDAGSLADYAEAARRLGVSRARLSQLLDLLLLSPEIQARVLSGEVECSERRVRPVAHAALWADQLALGRSVTGRITGDSDHCVASQRRGSS